MSKTIEEDMAAIFDRTKPALEQLAGSTVLVAGGAGFLPSYLIDALAYAGSRLPEPIRVLCLDNLVTGVAARLRHLEGRDDVVFLHRDITAPLEIGEQVDHVVHGASIASPTWYRQHPLETIDVNIGGTRRLLDLARNQSAGSFVHLSSSEIYGDPPPERVPTAEDYWGNVSCTGPRACYDESKRVGETLCTTYFRMYGTPVRIVRPFNVYGPRLRLDDGRVVPDFLRDALEGKQITILSSGEVTRSFCYVSDFVAAMILLMAASTDIDGEAFNVGNDEEVTIRRVAEVVDELAGGPGVRFETSEDPNYLTDNPSRRSPDLSKIASTVGWRPEIDLRAGLGRTLDHYRETGT